MTLLQVDGVIPNSLGVDGKLIMSEIDRRATLLRNAFPANLWAQAGDIFGRLEFDTEGMEAFLAALTPEGSTLRIPDLTTFAILIAALAPDAILTLMEAWPEPVSDLLRGIAACGDINLPHETYLDASMRAIPTTPAPVLGTPNRTRTREAVLAEIEEQRSLISALREEIQTLHREQQGAATPSRRIDKRISELRQELLAPIRALEAKEKVDTQHTSAYTTRINAVEHVVSADGAIARALAEVHAAMERQAGEIRELKARLASRPTHAPQPPPARAITFDVPSDEDEDEQYSDAFFKQGSSSLLKWRDAGVGIDRVSTLAFRTSFDNKIVARLRNSAMKRKAYEVLDNVLMLCKTPGSEKFEARVLRDYTFLALTAFENAGVATAVARAQKVDEWDPSLRAAITDARKKEKEKEKDRTRPHRERSRDRPRSKSRRRSTSGSNGTSERGGPGNGRGRGAGRGRGRGAVRGGPA